MSVKTEGKHPGEFLLSEGNGGISREVGILTSGQVIVDGQVVKIGAGTKLVVAAGSNNSAGSTEVIKGIYIGPAFTAAADTPIAYIGRLATVKDSGVTYHSGSADANKKAAVLAELKELFIIPRDGVDGSM